MDSQTFQDGQTTLAAHRVNVDTSYSRKPKLVEVGSNATGPVRGLAHVDAPAVS